MLLFVILSTDTIFSLNLSVSLSVSEKLIEYLDSRAVQHNVDHWSAHSDRQNHEQFYECEIRDQFELHLVPILILWLLGLISIISVVPDRYNDLQPQNPAKALDVYRNLCQVHILKARSLSTLYPSELSFHIQWLIQKRSKNVEVLLNITASFYLAESELFTDHD